MKREITTSLTLMAGLASSGSMHAQASTPATPTTRILAIGTINPGVDQTGDVDFPSVPLQQMVNESEANAGSSEHPPCVISWR